MMSRISFDVSSYGTGTKRMLNLDGTRIAATFIDDHPRRADYFNICWNLNEQFDLREGIEYWFMQVLQQNEGRQNSSPVILVVWKSEIPHYIEIQSLSSGDMVCEELDDMSRRGNVIEHVSLRREDCEVNFMFKPGKPMSCSCKFNRPFLSRISPFFAKYNENISAQSQDNLLKLADAELGFFELTPVG